MFPKTNNTPTSQSRLVMQVPRTKYTKTENKTKATNTVVNNSAYEEAFLDGGQMQPSNYAGSTLASGETLLLDSRAAPFSMNWQGISDIYVNHGFIQNFIKYPVNDAFRGNIKMRSSELSEDEVSELEKYMKRHKTWETIKEACHWSRLYGGAGIVIEDDSGEPNEPFASEALQENSFLKFYAADRWELTYRNPNVFAEKKPYNEDMDNSRFETLYAFYNVPLHKSRVIKINNDTAPSRKRPLFQGWGMSELEKIIHAISQYIKANQVLFEFVDEAKVSVYKFDGLTNTLNAPDGTRKVQKHVQSMDRVKNFHNALVFDSKDEFIQLQLDFAGMAQIYPEFRHYIASSMGMPESKIFGQAPTGLNSTGESDMENYNMIVENIRVQFAHVIEKMSDIICQKLFGFIPEDLEFEYPALRILSAEQEEIVKDRQFARIREALLQKVITKRDFAMQCNKAKLLPVEIDEKGVEDEYLEDEFPEDPQNGDNAFTIKKNPKLI